MFSSFNKILGISLLSLLVVACSSDKNYQRESGGSQKYLNAPKLVTLRTPANMALPTKADDYDIPSTRADGNTGLALDIRPPAQLIAILDGSQGEYQNSIAQIELPTHSVDLFNVVLSVLKKQNIKVNRVDRDKKEIETANYVWQRNDEKTPYAAKYLIIVDSSLGKSVIKTQLLSLSSNNQVIKDPIEIQRYGVALLNLVQTDLTKEQERQFAAHVDSVARQSLTFVDGVDNTGLPTIVTRATYKVVWARLLQVLKSAGFEVVTVNQSKGLMTVKYNGLTKKRLNDFGLGKLSLKEEEYQIQLGDLENRTSLQFSSKDGTILGDKDFKEMSSLIKAAFTSKK